MNSIIQIIKLTVIDILKNEGLLLKDVILFGSRATGNYYQQSDYDILVILKDSISHFQKVRLSSKIKSSLAKTLIENSDYSGCDIIIKSDIEYSDAIRNKWSVCYSAHNNGIQL